MIFPDKPRPKWQKPLTVQPSTEIPERPESPVSRTRPPGYYRERIELLVLILGFYFWVQYWIQFK